MNSLKSILPVLVASILFLILQAPGGLAPHNSALLGMSAQQPSAERDGQHDFDGLIGKWKYHLKRRQNPLTGSNTWVELDGISTVRKVWDGRANLGEFEVNSPTPHLQGLSLRLYNPQSHQWSI